MFINNTFKSRLSIIILSFYIFFEFGIHFNSLYAESGQNPPPQDRTQLSYRSQTFRPGDAVQISVYPDTSSFLNDIYNIDGNGNIFLPIRGKINVSNLSVIEFESYVKKNFAAYLRYPDVKVRPLIRVSLLGGFANPGLYYIDPDYTMWDLVHLAGGTLREDGLRKMKWERNRDIVEKNLIPFYESGKALNLIGFHSGDQIWTPTPKPLRTFWTVFRDVATVVTTAATLYFTYVTIIYIQTGRYRVR